MRRTTAPQPHSQSPALPVRHLRRAGSVAHGPPPYARGVPPAPPAPAPCMRPPRQAFMAAMGSHFEKLGEEQKAKAAAEQPGQVMLERKPGPLEQKAAQKPPQPVPDAEQARVRPPLRGSAMPAPGPMPPACPEGWRPPEGERATCDNSLSCHRTGTFHTPQACHTPQTCHAPLAKAVLQKPDVFFFSWGQPPGTTNRQPPTATNRQPPTATNRQPPTATGARNRRQPPPTANRNRQPPTTVNRQPLKLRRSHDHEAESVPVNVRFCWRYEGLPPPPPRTAWPQASLPGTPSVTAPRGTPLPHATPQRLRHPSRALHPHQRRQPPSSLLPCPAGVLRWTRSYRTTSCATC